MCGENTHPSAGCCTSLAPPAPRAGPPRPVFCLLVTQWSNQCSWPPISREDKWAMRYRLRAGCRDWMAVQIHVFSCTLHQPRTRHRSLWSSVKTCTDNGNDRYKHQGGKPISTTLFQFVVYSLLQFRFKCGVSSTGGVETLEERHTTCDVAKSRRSKGYCFAKTLASLLVLFLGFLF